MTILPKNFRRVITVMTMAGVVLLSGCHKSIQNDIKDLDKRLTAVEALAKSLDDQLKAGSLLKSATPLAGNSGWTLEFSNGTIVTFENAPGDDAVTPKIEIRPIEDGDGYSLWYNVTADYPDSGWVDTGVNIQGPAGGGSGTGPIDLRSYGGYIQYTTVANPSSSDWKNLFAIPANGSDGADGLSNIDAYFENNENGTATIVLGEDSYIFEIYQELPQSIVAILAEKSWEEENEWFKVTFRVNPSKADVSAAEWILDEIRSASYTRADNYEPTPSTALEIESVVPSQDGRVGEYVAMLIPTETFDVEADYLMALVLEVNGALISSNSFTIGWDLPMAEPVWFEEIAIGIVGEDAVAVEAPAELSMEIGEELTLAAMFTPANPDDTTVEWTMDPLDNEFVEFDDETGTIKALLHGEVTITVTTTFTGGEAKSDEITIVVAPIPAETIEITTMNGEPIEFDSEGVIQLELADETVTFVAEVGPEAASIKTVEWSSSDDTVATVDPNTGVVTIKGGGAVTITATATGSADPENTPLEASVDIYVTAFVNTVAIATADAPETAITTLPFTALGQTASLVPLFSTILEGVAPNVEDIEVTWSVVSEPSGAVTIDETGVITANMVGTATVTVTATGTSDGEPAVGTLEVTVTSPVTEVIVYPGEVTFSVFNEPDPVQLEVEILPDGALNPEVTWLSSNPALVSVVDGLITLEGVTEEEVIITATTANGIVGSCTVFVVQDLDGVVIDDDDITNILDNWVLKSPDDIDGIDPNNVAQLWNVAGGTQQPFYNIGDAAEFPAPDGVITIEQELEAAYGGGVDFDVAYEFVAQARWQQTGSSKNWFVDSVPENVENASVSPTGTITPDDDPTIVSGHNEFGDRLVIKVTITEAGEPSGVTLTPNPMVTYICVRLP